MTKYYPINEAAARRAKQAKRKIKDFPVEKAGRGYLVRVRRLASWLS